MLGALWAARVGPALEPALSEHQAAKHGGGCGANIARAFNHLGPARAGGGELGDIDEGLWAVALGPAADPVQAIIEQADGAELEDCPVVSLLDQDKAFERMGHGWMLAILDRWELPGWTAGIGEAVVTGRSAQAMVGGHLGPERRLLCGLGMGGPSSMLG